MAKEAGTCPAGAERTIPASESIVDELSRLHEHYVYEANVAVGEGREDRLTTLSDAYVDEALALLTGGAPSSTSVGR